MAAAWRHSDQPTAPRPREAPPYAPTRIAKTSSARASSTGMYAGPGLWSDPSGSLRLSNSTTTASAPSVTAATRFVVSIATDSTSSGHGHPGSRPPVPRRNHCRRSLHRPVRVATARDAVPALELGVITSLTIADELQKVTVGIEEVKAVVVAPIDGGV